MLFNWDSENVCVIFDWWRINGAGLMVASCIIIILLSIAYEGLREVARRYDAKLLKEMRFRRSAGLDELESGEGQAPHKASKEEELWRSLIYALQVAVAFLLMLVFMTYNVYLMLATVVGAGIGHFFFARRAGAERPLSCH
ncbi:Ctr copper transporter [Thamnocephalis sphaerospora]|uniref:Copper transport protein n=1 Tax=Thamnocephalis sphaerospora TaxID=78915 RepID=A0A4P9XNI4_9FUNG|nr:Ctr copper transporter [Thamnocephalis sphaerospora]|eukprot:RKP07533.1 Ctr copper transporter [Thamnocephalis sphaerospora]